MAASAETVPLRPAWYEGRFASWLVTTDHKRIGLLYISTSLFFFVCGGILALLMRASSPRRTRTSSCATATASFHDPRHGHGLPRGRADPRRLRQLPRAADDRRARRRVPSAERDVVLALPVRRRRRSPRASSPPAARRSAAGRATRRSRRPQYTPGTRRRPLDPLAAPAAIASLASAINFIATIHNMRAPGMTWMRMPLFVWTIYIYSVMLLLVLPALSAGLTLLLLDRQRRNPLLRPDAGRQRGALAARLLVLRPPRGLHHDPAGDGDGLGDHPRLRAEADLRLQGGRVLDGRDRLLLDARLGAPHVRRRDADLAHSSS